MTPVRKKILFAIPSLPIGGAERVMVTLLNHLDRSRFEPHLAMVQKTGFYLKDVPPDVPIHDLKATRVRWAVPKLIRLAWELKPHVLHTSMPELNMAAVLSRPFLPAGVRVLIREEIVGSVDTAETRKHPAVWNWLYRRLYSRADKVICLSKFVLNDLAEMGIPRRVLVHLYPPVDTKLVARLGNEGGNPFEGQGPHLLAAGRLQKRKGFDILLEAMPRVCAAVPGAQLTILGEGVLKQELLAQRERLGLNQTVHLIGYKPNPFLYFKHADLFVLSSTNEGFGLVVVEALAVGTPVVAAPCRGVLREILGDCPMSWVAPSGGASALAETIISALKASSRRAHPLSSLQSFLNRYDAESVMREYEKLLEE
jgi:glycosyltransferase involved in cell wall biosynthesis